jgi:nucleotide-binding universal stress UspA family protein
MAMTQVPPLPSGLADEEGAASENGAPSIRVLLAADGSEAASIAEAWTVRLRWAIPPRVDILCVARPRRLAAGLALQTYRDAVRAAVSDLRQADLVMALRAANSVGERLQSARLLTRTWARQGDPASEIGAMVRADGPDLVIIGAGGRRGWFSPREVWAEVVGQTDAAVLVTRVVDAANERLPRRIAAMTNGGGEDQFRAWLGWAGWLDGAEVIDADPADLQAIAAESPPDLAVIGRRPGSRNSDHVLRETLEWASAALVLPLAPYDPKDEPAA